MALQCQDGCVVLTEVSDQYSLESYISARLDLLWRERKARRVLLGMRASFGLLLAGVAGM